MVTKEARLDLRLDKEAKAGIERAASISRESTSSFVVHAAAAAADRVSARADVTIMPADQFDELFAALDVPEDAATLARVARREPRYVRK